MRLQDASGGVAEIHAGPGRALHVEITASADRLVTAARVVHADVLRRAAERHRASVTVSVAGGASPDTVQDAATLGCRPLTAPSGVPDVVVGDAPGGRGVRWSPRGAVPSLDLVGRLAVLAGCDVDQAHAELERWRDAVAAWAEHPSRPMCADYVGWIDTATDDGLDMPRVLALLREVEVHADLPPGSKFETFAHVDQVLGVDLACRVGLSR